MCEIIDDINQLISHSNEIENKIDIDRAFYIWLVMHKRSLVAYEYDLAIIDEWIQTHLASLSMDYQKAINAAVEIDLPLDKMKLFALKKWMQ